MQRVCVVALSLAGFAMEGCFAPLLPPNLSIDAASWRADLEVVRRELPERHVNAFHAISREAFERGLDELEAQASQDADGRFVGLFRVVNLIGDGHTSVRMPTDRAVFPLEIGEFRSELRVARTAPGFEGALGAKVVGIGDVPIGEVLTRTLELTPADENPPLRRALATRYLSTGMILHGLGVIADRRRAAYRLEGDDGRMFTMELPSMPSWDRSAWVKPYHGLTLAEQHPGDPFWCVALPAAAVYCDFRAYDGLSSRADSMMGLLRESRAQKLVIDLRDNGGGDYTEGQSQVVEPLQRLNSINRKGHLFVLIGPETFSAAMNNAAQFRTMTAAILVGETIGEKPNSYQEPREFVLPASHLVVRYSTRWYAFVDGGPNSVDPDVRVVPSWPEYAVGRDPALEYALSAQ